jgi:hypothetical protein
MANKTVPTSNGVNLVVDNNGKVVQAFTQSNNTPTYLPSNDPKVTAAISNLNNSPALKTALKLPNTTTTVAQNYDKNGTRSTTQTQPPNQTNNTSNPNPNNDTKYNPIFTGQGGTTKALIYPLDLSKDQDRMIITMYRYRNTINNFIDESIGGRPGGRDISNVEEGDGKPLAYIVLPMPNTINDISKVEWSADVLPISQLASAGIGGAINNIAQRRIRGLEQSNIGRTEFLNQRDQINKNANDANAKIDGVLQERFLSRFTGTITNPNQDLLFTGNGLRNFTYSFDLFPRNKAESEEIRRIVRTFRQGMLPRKLEAGILVGAPNVFRIRFIKGGTNQPLKDVRRHKELALTSFVADPTPGDVWMTHNDADHSTIGFKVLMGFTELVPIYYNDFVDAEGKEIKDINGDPIEGSIGY